MSDAPFDLLVTGGTVVHPKLGPFQADIGVRAGKIAAVGASELGEARQSIDARGLHVFPGAVDPHAHIGLGGGLDEYRPDTGAALLGGVTTVFYILIDSGSYVDALEIHVDAAMANALTDFGFHLTLMTTEHIEELAEVNRRWGVNSYKYYMSFRGEEGAYLGVEGTDDGYFDRLLEAIADRDGVLAVHAENIEIVWELRRRLQSTSPELPDLKIWDRSRPDFVEAEAIQRAAFLGARHGTDLYIVHLSAGAAVDEVRHARSRHRDLQIHAETCPHFLTHTVESPVGTLGKVNPPLRSPEDVEALWDAIADGTIDTVGSDHVGRRRDRKKGSIWEASAGFPGLPLTLPVLLSEGFHRRGIPLEMIARLTALRPAQIFGLAARKGSLDIGHDADLAIVDLDWERTVSADWLGTWSDYSLYEGWDIRSWPRYTIRRGEILQTNGQLVEAPPPGQLATAP